MNRVKVANVLDRLGAATVPNVVELTLELEPRTFNIHTVNEVPLAMDHCLRVIAPHVVPAILGKVASVLHEVYVHGMHV